MNYPKFSIIIPNLNQGQFIEEAITSVLNQNYPNLELFVFDGGSTDNSIEVIKKYDKYITYWESIEDKGQSHAINKGIRKCTGDYFNWLNADDYLEKNCLTEVAKVINTENQIVIGKLKTFGNTRSQIKRTELFNGNKAKSIGRVLLAQPAMFFPKSILNFNTETVNETLQYSFDREWWIKMVLENSAFELKTVDFVISNFRYHDDSKTVNNSYQYFYSDNSQIYAYLARVIGLTEISNILLKSKFIESKSEYKPTFDNDILIENNELLSKAINFYLIEIGHVLLKFSRFNDLKEILNHVRFSHLDFVDKRLYLTLQLKNQLKLFIH